MKIVVLNGSPKGELSVTLQYVRYLEKKEPGHDWKIFPIAEQIGKIERDVQAFQGIIGEIERADVVIWAFPLYYFLVCSQYKRFIELIFERKATAAFDGKYAASVSTSVHFFDHTAHNYIHGICDDLQMRYVGSYSAEMYDLVHSAERRRWLGFAGHLLSAAVRGVPTERAYPPLTLSRFAYTPGPAGSAVETRGRKILILWDGQEGEGNIPAMIEVFRRNCSEPVDVASLADVDIRGGCLGCCRCGLDNICVYTGKDGFIEFFNEKVKKAEILIFAGAIRDRYLSSRWKTYFDRSFFNTHMPVLKGKQFGFLVSGPLGQLPNLRQILSAYVEVQQGGFAGIVTDEAEDSRLIDALIGGTCYAGSPPGSRGISGASDLSRPGRPQGLSRRGLGQAPLCLSGRSPLLQIPRPVRFSSEEFQGPAHESCHDPPDEDSAVPEEIFEDDRQGDGQTPPADRKETISSRNPISKKENVHGNGNTDSAEDPRQEKNGPADRRDGQTRRLDQ